MYDQKNAFETKNFKGKLIFEQFRIFSGFLQEEIKGTFQWQWYLS